VYLVEKGAKLTDRHPDNLSLFGTADEASGRFCSGSGADNQTQLKAVSLLTQCDDAAPSNTRD